MTKDELQKWEAEIRGQNIQFKRAKRPCGYGARYNGNTVRSEIQTRTN